MVWQGAYFCVAENREEASKKAETHDYLVNPDEWEEYDNLDTVVRVYGDL